MRINPYRMAWSFRVGRIFGIDVKVHLVFVVLLLLLCVDTVIWSGSLTEGARMLFLLLLLFGFVLLHELGHSLAAKKAGIKVVDITLWMLGGLARLDGEIEDPRVEFKIALAGPMVNIVLIPVFYILYRTFQGREGGVLYYALMVNLLMGGVNLIPAFPLDGGRVLRSLAAKRMPFVKATRLAVSIGRILALGGIIIAFFTRDYFWVVTLICLFVLWAGSVELRAVKAREAWRRRGGAQADQSSPVIEAEVVSTESGGGNEDSAGDPDLKSFEKDFIDMVKRYRKGKEGS